MCAFNSSSLAWLYLILNLSLYEQKTVCFTYIVSFILFVPRNTLTKVQGLVPLVCLMIMLEGENGLDNVTEEGESINSLASHSEPTLSLNYREVVSDVTSVNSSAVDRWAQSPDEGENS